MKRWHVEQMRIKRGIENIFTRGQMLQDLMEYFNIDSDDATYILSDHGISFPDFLAKNRPRDGISEERRLELVKLSLGEDYKESYSNKKNYE